MNLNLNKNLAFYLSPQPQALPLPIAPTPPPNPSSRLRTRPIQTLQPSERERQPLDRSPSLETLPAPTVVRRVPISNRDIGYETEAAVMRTFQRQDERNRERRANSNTRFPRPSHG